VEPLLAEDGQRSAIWLSADRDCARIDIFYDDRSAAVRKRHSLRSTLPRQTYVALRTLRQEDWAETWKRHFHTQQVSARIWVRPSWEPAPAGRGRVVIVMDPGLSFGTGQHPTTRGCLRLIDRLGPQGRSKAALLDLGCGSGILAIAAAKLGFRRVAAWDNDPDAVRIARQNCTRNRVGQRVRCAVADLAAASLRRPYDVVVANILSGVLIRHARTVAGLVSGRNRGKLILSGILNRQYPAVRKAYAQLGFEEEQAVRLGAWTSVCLTASHA